MRIIFVRHCDPYYPTDSLTKKGFKEAKLLSQRIKKWNVVKAYSSPMGRAFTTAKIGLSKNVYVKQNEIIVCPWLREFNYPVIDPLTNNKRASWDLLPEFFTADENRDLFDFASWQNNSFLETGEIASYYKSVCDGLDSILVEFDYKRNGLYYSTVRKDGQSDFMEKLTEKIHRHNIDVGHLEIEITEGMLIDNVDETVRKLNKIRGLGIGLSLDDFGTGYSSLRYLQILPLTTLKIDKSFISNINDKDGIEANITESIVSMVSKMGLDTIAEGVETPDQLNMLKKFNCHTVQGFLKGKPMPQNICEKVLGGDNSAILTIANDQSGS